MQSRPLLNSGIDELERLFDQRRDDKAFLKTLAQELKNRKTKRAQDLLARVVAGMGQRSPATSEPINLPKVEVAVPMPERAPVAANATPRFPAPAETPPPQPSRPLSSGMEPPPITNTPANVLSAWTCIEVLSPPSFRRPEDLVSGDRYRIADIDGKQLPWETGERSRPNNRLYYQIVLGTVRLDAAVSALLAIYSDTREERPSSTGEAVLATVMVDKDGRLVDPDPISISSFAWGVPVALRGELSGLDRWSQVEAGLVEQLAAGLSREDGDGNPLPITRERIDAAYAWLIKTLGLTADLVRPPSFVVRSYQYFKFPDPPESILLNSFFLDDLAKAREQERTGVMSRNLKRYLQAIVPEARANLLKDQAALRRSVQPKKLPLASWPANGRNSLALLQQCAVNTIFSDLKSEGIVAVNGPPGTGKTTLLRDIIAANVADRAGVLCSYQDPESAFTHSGQKIRKGGGFVHLYSLDEKVRGFEMLVASSNNRAVENVSAELPASDAVASDTPDLRYFKTTSDAMLDRDTWGAIAAVLGNAKNRGDFRQKFWWDEDTGLQKYLQHASGNPQLITEQTADGPLQRHPLVVSKEDAPRDHDEALRVWKRIRQNYKKTSTRAAAAIAELQKLQDTVFAIEANTASVEALSAERQHLLDAIAPLAEANQATLAQMAHHQGVAQAAEKDWVASLGRTPSWFARLFNLAAFKDWSARHARLSATLQEATGTLKQRVSVAQESKSALDRANYEVAKNEASSAAFREAIARDEAALVAAREHHAGVLMRANFFELSHADRQKTAPWLDAATSRLRNDVFEAAMAVHKAFVDAAAKPIRHNLNVLMDGFGTRSLGSPQKDLMIPHMWSTLFLVVPVVSTTFASVARMFPKLGSGALGWLLVDEAGQALPQAAVGALMRTRRAVVVGDPIQIEPVVVLPDRLTEAMCAQFGIDPVVFNAPGASVQTLADSVTAYYGTFETKFGTREVGIPLLVHRRCAEPMFSISNAIAYENLMVQAKPDKPSAIRDALGPSAWLHIEGRGQEKWCGREGDVLLEMLRRLREIHCVPDIYIVTPFVIVQDRIRELLRSSGILEGWVENPYLWLRDRVGTVHTVQGREAEAVFFVLGAPDPAQRGARGWAGGKPNLLNVATTRAKEALYVVGNRELWKSAGVFQNLDVFLPGR
ncbi:DEAD/DEAH box helicase [Rhizobium leguminosarum]|uniref:DEAD/DEAH box helicase n=1 Tax=Rhizobium leguminosarum TaxID=384 RepID=UPI0013EE9929|nr:AAA domain-containing protein [Rhizobium leguminosarum]